VPIYEFACEGCEGRFDELMPRAPQCVACPNCGSSRTRRLLSRVSPAGRQPRGARVRSSESPGAEEDRQGLPFVGRAGQLLNQMLEGIGMSREDVFIANVLKSRPPGNRDPQPQEIETCKPYLFEQVRLIEPTVICTLGNFSTKLLSGNPAGITKVRGAPQVHELGGRTVFLFPLFHPAAALRTPAVKETLREDFAKLPSLLAMGPPVAAEEPEDEPSGDEVDSAPEVPADQLDFFG